MTPRPCVYSNRWSAVATPAVLLRGGKAMPQHVYRQLLALALPPRPHGGLVYAKHPIGWVAFDTLTGLFDDIDELNPQPEEEDDA